MEQAVGLEPSFVEAWNVLALTEDALGDEAKARQAYFRGAYRIRPPMLILRDADITEPIKEVTPDDIKIEDIADAAFVPKLALLVELQDGDTSSPAYSFAGTPEQMDQLWCHTSQIAGCYPEVEKAANNAASEAFRIQDGHQLAALNTRMFESPENYFLAALHQRYLRVYDEDAELTRLYHDWYGMLYCGDRRGGGGKLPAECSETELQAASSDINRRLNQSRVALQKRYRPGEQVPCAEYRKLAVAAVSEMQPYLSKFESRFRNFYGAWRQRATAIVRSVENAHWRVGFERLLEFDSTHHRSTFTAGVKATRVLDLAHHTCPFGEPLPPPEVRPPPPTEADLKCFARLLGRGMEASVPGFEHLPKAMGLPSFGMKLSHTCTSQTLEFSAEAGIPDNPLVNSGVGLFGNVENATSGEITVGAGVSQEVLMHELESLLGPKTGFSDKFGAWLKTDKNGRPAKIEIGRRSEWVERHGYIDYTTLAANNSNSVITIDLIPSPPTGLQEFKPPAPPP